MTADQLHTALENLIAENPTITVRQAWQQLGQPRHINTIRRHLNKIRRPPTPTPEDLSKMLLTGYHRALRDGNHPLALDHLKELRQIVKQIDTPTPAHTPADTRTAILKLTNTKR